MTIKAFTESQSGPYDRAKDICAHAWQQFEAQFPTEEHCWRELCRRLETSGLSKCCYCGSKRLDENYEARVRRCRSCNKNTWLTAGTFFNRMRLARPWLAAIWLLEQGVVISSLHLHELVGIAQSSALHILKKVAMAIESHFGDDSANIPSGLFCRVFCKRSRLTPAMQHPVKEQEEMERNESTSADLVLQVNRTNVFASSSGQQLDSNTESIIETDTAKFTTENKLAAPEKTIYDLLSKEPMSFDTLCKITELSVSEISAALTMLEIVGAAKRLPGDQYVRCTSKESVRKTPGVCSFQNSEDVSDIINFIRSRFHGISRKYLQLYLALYWCHIARDRWCSGSLLQACLKFGRISREQCLAYVSPLIVKSWTKST